MKKALITGITGQDAAYLSKLLLMKGYSIIGTCRKKNNSNFWRLEELDVISNKNFKIIEYDLSCASNIEPIIKKYKPDEIYNLAAQSAVDSSFNDPYITAKITGIAVLNILESIKQVDPKIKFFQASSSEMFGKANSYPQNELTKFNPQSPYAISKLFAYWITRNYRDAYNIFASNGILYNHESPLRSSNYVVRKITSSVAKIHLKKLDSFELGNLDSKRDWGSAEEYVDGMYKILQHQSPDDFILSTNKLNSLRDILILAFQRVGIEIFFEGSGKKEVVKNRSTNKILVTVNQELYRPLDVTLSVGDNSKASNELNWRPMKTISEIVNDMIDVDIMRLQNSNKYK
jgi:GDPmannose 4,6-dehydratase